MVRNGFNDGSYDMLLLRAGEQEVESCGKTVHVRDVGQEIEGTINRL